MISGFVRVGFPVGLCPVFAVLLSCAGAPAGSPPTVPAVTAVAPAAVTRADDLDLFCGPRAEIVSFSMPPDQVAADVALTREYVWVLFQPARLLRIDRSGQGGIEEYRGAKGEIWTGVDGDPQDGSVWVATSDYRFHQIFPDRPMRTVRLQRDVIGPSGLARLVVRPDALLLEPMCGEYGLWRMDRDGQLLDTAFREEQTASPESLAADSKLLQCSLLRLQRDTDGGVLALDVRRHKVYRARQPAVSGMAGWDEIPVSWTDRMPGCFPGQIYVRDVAGAERWYSSGFASCLFSWKGRLVLFGGEGGEVGPVDHRELFVPAEAGGGRTWPIRCAGEVLRDVATDGEGYAGLTADRVYFGRFADAPDLP